MYKEKSQNNIFYNICNLIQSNDEKVNRQILSYPPIKHKTFQYIISIFLKKNSHIHRAIFTISF